MPVSAVKYPIGVQSFATIRQEDMAYVDKTALMHELISTSQFVFLARPRRFGKSLLLSTIGAYFEGRKDLFEGLAIDRLTKDWVQRAVFRLDFSAEFYNSPQVVTKVLEWHLRQWEAMYGQPDGEQTLSQRFATVIRRAHQATGHRVVILVDEYDCPLLGLIDNEAMSEEVRGMLKSFYGNIKRESAHVRFAMLTGVTRFARVSVFSDINNLADISMSDRFASICGITDPEVQQYFAPGIANLAQTLGVGYDEAAKQLQQHYDGYRFTPKCPRLYNPFSLMSALAMQQIEDYWYATGTTTFLAKRVKQDEWRLPDLQRAISRPTDLSNIESYRDPVPLLFQTGYLTIKDYDSETREYVLGYPNTEVRNGFMHSLFAVYVRQGLRSDFDVSSFKRDICGGYVDSFMERLTALFANIPAQQRPRRYEYEFQNIVYVVFMMLGQMVRTEVNVGRGRADMVVVYRDQVYIFEFKFGDTHTPAEALEQIADRRYASAYAASGKKLTGIGAVYYPDEGRLDWLSREF